MKKLVIFDGNSLMHSCYHAIPPLNAPDGTPTNAVFGFIKAILEDTGIMGNDCCVVFDRGKSTYRTGIYPEYKGGRPPMDEDLRVQFPLAEKFLELAGIPSNSIEGIEADDIIANLVERRSRVQEVIVVTRDMDMTQLAELPNVTIRLVKGRGIAYDVTTETAKSILGMEASQVQLYKSLYGDDSDNIPGVSKIGKIKAKKIVEKYGTEENLREILKSGKTNDKDVLRILGDIHNFELSNALVKFLKLSDEDMAKLNTERTLGDEAAVVEFTESLGMHIF